MVDSPARRRTLGMVLGGVLSATAGCASLVGLDGGGRDASIWPMPGYDAANTGFAPDRRAVPVSGGASWTVDENDVAIVAGDTLYQQGLAREADGGEVAWRTSKTRYESSRAAPAYRDGVVYSHDGGPVAIDATDGSVRWRADEELVGGSGWLRVTDDGVFGVTDPKGYPDEEPTLFALDPATGELRWSRALPDAARFGPVVGDGVVVVATDAGSGRGGVVIATSVDGDERWQARTNDRPWSELTIGDGAVYGADTGGTVYALELDGGDVRWRDSTSGVSMRFCYGEHRLYLDADGLRALDTADGSTVWRSDVDAGPASVDADAVYCIARDDVGMPRYLQVVDRETHEQTWTTEFPTVTRGDIAAGGVRGRPALVDGGVYVAAADGLYAFATES